MRSVVAKKLRKEIREKTVGLPWGIPATVDGQRRLAKGCPKRLYRLAKKRYQTCHIEQSHAW